jgi:predicted SAM-dependent methyltransferase
MRLNLGCCDRHRHGWVNVDIVPPADQIADLRQPWPWPDSSVDAIVAHDLIEHIPAEILRVTKHDGVVVDVYMENGRIFLMNEAWRVLKPGGTFEIIVPSASRGAGFVQDLTHKSQWCLNSFQYVTAGKFAHTRLARPYGITAAFRVIRLDEQEVRDEYEAVWKITAILEAVK